jgi:hypothetical protein
LEYYPQENLIIGYRFHVKNVGLKNGEEKPDICHPSSISNKITKIT